MTQSRGNYFQWSMKQNCSIILAFPQQKYFLSFLSDRCLSTRNIKENHSYNLILGWNISLWSMNRETDGPWNISLWSTNRETDGPWNTTIFSNNIFYSKKCATGFGFFIKPSSGTGITSTLYTKHYYLKRREWCVSFTDIHIDMC